MPKNLMPLILSFMFLGGCVSTTSGLSITTTTTTAAQSKSQRH
jgi:hypothetical protein